MTHAKGHSGDERALQKAPGRPLAPALVWYDTDLACLGSILLPMFYPSREQTSVFIMPLPLIDTARYLKEGAEKPGTPLMNEERCKWLS
jgi:hypothetical protein